MLNDHYPYHASSRKTRFFFESDGLQGKVIKVVIFRQLDERRWNLGFGDWKRGKVEDSIVTNNNDVLKVLNTVAKATYDFFTEHQQSIVVINPVDEKRKRLYNHVFQRRFHEIAPNFVVLGYISGVAEPYSPEKLYDEFEITLNFES